MILPKNDVMLLVMGVSFITICIAVFTFFLDAITSNRPSDTFLQMHHIMEYKLSSEHKIS